MTKAEYICIYHDKCPDGFAAAWAVFRALGANVNYVAGQYGKPMPNVKGKHVIMVDFSYSYDEIVRAGKESASLLILDHHDSAEKNLAPFALKGSIERARSAWDVAREEVDVICYFDKKHSGARLAWDFFHPGKAVPSLINYVEDRDLWRHDLPYTKELNQWIMSFKHSFATFDYLDTILDSDEGFSGAVLGGQSILRSQSQIIENTVADGLLSIKIGGIEMPVVNVPHALASDTGDYLKRMSPIAAMYVDLPRGRKFSLRVRDDSDIKANEIAALYGGGGHEKAASFIVKSGWMGEE